MYGAVGVRLLVVDSVQTWRLVYRVGCRRGLSFSCSLQSLVSGKVPPLFVLADGPLSARCCSAQRIDSGVVVFCSLQSLVSGIVVVCCSLQSLVSGQVFSRTIDRSHAVPLTRLEVYRFQAECRRTDVSTSIHQLVPLPEVRFPGFATSVVSQPQAKLAACSRVGPHM